MEGVRDKSLPIYPLRARESIEQRVAQRLRGLIIAGHLREGMPLVQRDLASRLGVSQTPIRAGLTQLEREGFVVLGPTGRAVVSMLTREDFEEIYATRHGLEGLAARVGAPAVGHEELESMSVSLANLRDAARSQDVDNYLSLRWDFYGTCYRASGRRRLVDQVEQLYNRSERYNRIVLSTPQRFRQSVGRYAAFYAACKARDGVAAEHIVQGSLSWAVERIASDLPSETDPL